MTFLLEKELRFWVQPNFEKLKLPVSSRISTTDSKNFKQYFQLELAPSQIAD